MCVSEELLVKLDKKDRDQNRENNMMGGGREEVSWPALLTVSHFSIKSVAFKGHKKSPRFI